MRLYLQTLQSRDVDEAQRKQFYEIMLADAERLHLTVEQVLKAGSLSQKRKRVPWSPVDMATVARECVQLALVRHHLNPGAIALEAHDEGPLMVSGDAEELSAVLRNLLDNAVKYSGDNVRVTVSLAAPTPKTIWVRVQDHGAGIPRKQLKRIFNRFYRVQTRGLRQVKGTGLGLYIVKEIARAHGGRVFAQSEGEGRGATITVELPRLIAQEGSIATSRTGYSLRRRRACRHEPHPDRRRRAAHRERAPLQPRSGRARGDRRGRRRERARA